MVANYRLMLGGANDNQPPDAEGGSSSTVQETEAEEA
jgi:hypothetical protein